MGSQMSQHLSQLKSGQKWRLIYFPLQTCNYFKTSLKGLTADVKSAAINLGSGFDSEPGNGKGLHPAFSGKEIFQILSCSFLRGDLAQAVNPLLSHLDYCKALYFTPR